MKIRTLIQLVVGVLLFNWTLAAAPAAFTSLRIFGDGLSTTTNNSTPYTNYYYGKRYSNGRVWVEVLAQRLGLCADSITNANWSDSPNNWSYYGQYSPNLMTNVNHCALPLDAGTSLFVVWVNNADFVNDMGSIYPSTNIVTWNNAINQSLANHWNIITNLYYTKGARVLIMPNAVDITEIPEYNGLILSAPATRNFIRQRVIDFNNGFAALLNQARTSLPGITIYEPDFFALLDNVLTNAAAYGLTNALYNGVSIDAMEDPNLKNVAINGPGTNYIFWDATDPTAKTHEIMADIALQQVAPPRISQLTVLQSSNQLDVANVPIGLNGYVDGCTNLAAINWVPLQSVISIAPQQTVFVPTNTWAQVSSQIVPRDSGPPVPPGGGSGSNSVTGAQQYFRLRFPYNWTWP